MVLTLRQEREKCIRIQSCELRKSTEFVQLHFLSFHFSSKKKKLRILTTSILLACDKPFQSTFERVPLCSKKRERFKVPRSKMKIRKTVAIFTANYSSFLFHSLFLVFVLNLLAERKISFFSFFSPRELSKYLENDENNSKF